MMYTYIAKSYWYPRTTFLLTFSRSWLNGFLFLPEIESFFRVKNSSNCFSQISIRNFSVVVIIKMIKDQLELCICEMKTPTLESILKIICVYVSSFFLGYVLKCLFQSRPLQSKFTKYFLHQMFEILTMIFIQFLPIHLLSLILAVLVFYILWIHIWVVPKIKSFSQMYGFTNPVGKIMTI